MNRLELLRALRRHADGPAEEDDYPDWPSTIRLASEIAEREELVLILDEAQHIFESSDKLTRRIFEAWRREAGENLTLVLSCTGTTLDRSVGLDSEELGDAIDWSAKLETFDYLDAGKLVAERPPGQKAYLYGIFGGRPGMLSTIRSDESLGEAAVEHVLSPDGDVFAELSSVLLRRPGIRNPGPYRAVLSAVAGGARETMQVARSAGLADRPTVARRALETLEELDLIDRRRNFGAGKRSAWKNRISDPAVRFWFRFAHRYRTELQVGDPQEVWSDHVMPDLDDYMQVVYERIAEQAFQRLHSRWGLHAPHRWTRWSGLDRNRKPIEIDIVAELEDGQLLTGQVRWTPDPLDHEVHFHLQRDLQALAGLGEDWAEAALDPERSHGHLYVSAGGFTDYFRDKARSSDRLTLVSLDELYSEGD